MTSRERLRQAVNFQPVRRVPIELRGLSASRSIATASERLPLQLGIHSISRGFGLRLMSALEAPVPPCSHRAGRTFDRIISLTGRRSPSRNSATIANCRRVVRAFETMQT